MKRTRTLAALLVSLVLMADLATSTLLVQGEEPTEAVKKPKVTVSDVSESTFSAYNMTAETADGERVTFLFAWQWSLEWNFSLFSGKLTFDTPPILQISKYEENGTLEYSVTYIPLFLIQYNDTNGNSLFDVRTKGSKHVTSEVEDGQIDWSNQRDKPYKAYPLAPIFRFKKSDAWRWEVSQLRSENITVGDTLVPTYSWTVYTTVPSARWSECILPREEGLREPSTIDVSFGYHVRFLPENPEVKYDFKFSGVGWVDKEAKLVMLSAIAYRGGRSVAVRIGEERHFNFSNTVSVSVSVRRFMISDNVTDNINAFVSYSPDAVVDGVKAENVVNTAIHPLFLIPFKIVGLTYSLRDTRLKGVFPGLGKKRLWGHYLAFAHQLGLPHFKDSVEQDPTISIAAALLTVRLASSPNSLASLETLTAVVAVSTAAVAAVYIFKKRKMRANRFIRTQKPPSAPSLFCLQSRHESHRLHRF